MTKTYYDIDAVTRLLEEKERDLELAAKIGQSLLENNQQLQSRVETLEQDIRNANESVAQLTHEVHLKNEMLKVYLREEEAECERRCAEEAALAASRQSEAEQRYRPERRRADRFDTVHSSVDEAAHDSNANDISVSSARDSNDGPSTDTSPQRSRSHLEPVLYTNERDSFSHPQDVNSEIVSALNHTLDELQRRIASLERENNALREQHRELRRDESELEATEQTLVNEVIRQLGDANNQIVSLSEDVTRKTDLCVKQQEDNASLLANNIDLESRVRRLVADNEELERRLREAHAVQHELTDELGDLRSRVAELSAQLNDAQDEVRTLRRRRTSHASRAAAASSVGGAMTLSRYSMTSSMNESSLAAEINDSLRQHPGDARNMPFEIGISTPQPSAAMCNTLSALHTVRTANAARCATGSTSGHESMDEQQLPRAAAAAAAGNSGLPLDADAQFDSSEFASPRHSSRPAACPYAATAASTPRMQSASVPMSMTPTPTHVPFVQRSTRSHAGSSCSSRSISPSDSILALEMTNSSMFSSLISHQTRKTNSGTTTQLASPLDTCHERTLSRMSGISGQTGNSAFMRNCYPKLQIVKPLAGSLTLSWWQQLATPNLGSVLQSKTGIQTRSESQLAFDEDKLTLSDVDEDDERERIEAHRLSWKSASNSSSIYTCSTSRILHPTDNNVYGRSTSGRTSQVSPRTSMASASLSTKTSTVYSMGSTSTLRSNSTSKSRSTAAPRQPASTFSVTMGLAEVLKERGVRAAESRPASDQPSVADELESVRSDGEQSLSLSPSKSQSQAIRLPTLSVPSVMNASQSVTERVFAPPPATSSAQLQPSIMPSSDAAPRLDSKDEHAAAMQVNKLDYFGIFKMVKTVTSRVFAPNAGTTAETAENELNDGSAESAQPNDVDASPDDTTRPLWRPDPGSLSEKTLRYVSSSPNLQNLVSPNRPSSASSSRSVATVTTANTNSTMSHLASERLSGSTSVSSTPKTPTSGRHVLPRGLNLLAQPSDGATTFTGVLGGTSSRIVTRAASSAAADQCKSTMDTQ